MGLLGDTSISIPSGNALPLPISIDFVDSDLNNPLSFDFGLGDIDIDMGLDNINVCIGGKTDDNGNPMPAVFDFGIGGTDKPIDLDLDLDMGLDNIGIGGTDKPIKIDMGLDNVNLCFSFAIKELPSMKFHFPTNYEFGLELFGRKVFNFCIGGKSMVVTEQNPVKIMHHPFLDNPRRLAGQKQLPQSHGPAVKVSIDE